MGRSIIERAYEMANSGKWKTVGEIEHALGKHDYEGVYLHFRSRSLRKDLASILRGRLQKRVKPEEVTAGK